MKRQTKGVSLERAIKIIMDTEPSLTDEIIEKYTISEIKEWMKLLKIKTNF